MCGRFTLKTDPETLTETFPGFTTPAADEMSPRYNIAPSQQVAVVANNGDNSVEFFQWGLIPSWAKDPKIGNRMINARSETLAEKPSFRTAYKRRRCLILTDGFYEWKAEPGSKTKTPHYIRLKSEKPFAFAGLWEAWSPNIDDDPLLSCTIITTSPNSSWKPSIDGCRSSLSLTATSSGWIRAINPQSVGRTPRGVSRRRDGGLSGVAPCQSA